MNRRAQFGMTLLEVLVTLLIVGMVASLAAQALQQFARVERVLEDAGSSGQQRMLRREWIRALIAGVQPELTGSPLQFRGDEQGFVFRSAQPLAHLGNAPLRLELKHDSARRENTLILRAAGDAASPIQLLSWPGEPARIRYLDRAGGWQSRWPMENADPEAPRHPPALVRLELGPEAGGVLLAPVAGSEGPRPSLAALIDG